MPRAASPRRPATPAHLRHRVQRLQKRLARAGVDALLVTNPRDIRYLTGFVGDDSWALVPRRGSTVDLLSDFRFQEQIQREAPHARAWIRRQSLADELARLIDRRRLDRVGYQAQHVSVALRKQLVRKIGASHLADLDDGLLQQRAVKDSREIRAICRALEIQQLAYRKTLRFLRPGQSEQEVAAYLEYQMRKLGADGPSFPTIVAADASASLPHAIPGPRKLRKNGIVLIDWGARWGGYCSDLTRVVALGRMPPKLREIYQIVLDAQLAAIDAIAPGKPLKEVDAAARRLIERAGYGRQFGHSLGHGIGLDIHEMPTLSPRSDKGELEPGHVVTVEPGIYLPGIGGVRIEDDVLVTPRGAQVLSRLPKDLKSAMI